MGMIAKATAGRLTQTQPMTVGPWVNELAAECDLLDATVAVRLGMLRAFINTDPGDAESYFVFANEKRIPAATAGTRKKRVLVRVDVNDQQLTCGAPGHGWLTKDWTLEAKAKQPGDGAVVVTQRRTIDDAVPNSGLLKQTRDTIAGVMHDGPGRVTVAPGGFHLDGMVERRTVPEDSLFYGDHFYPVPDSFHHEAKIELPTRSRTAIQEVLHNGFSPAIPSGSGREGIALDGGRGLDSCFIELAGDDASPKLVFRLPADEGMVSRQRTFRAALRCLLGLSLKLAGKHDEAAAALRSFIEVSTEGRLDPERRSRFISASGKSEPIGMVVLKPGAQLPVISTVQTTCNGSSIDDFLSMAMGWVLPRERSWSQGLRAARGIRIATSQDAGRRNVQSMESFCVPIATANTTRSPSSGTRRSMTASCGSGR